ncbi:unnamed protein product [Alopecurus aequalis]
MSINRCSRSGARRSGDVPLPLIPCIPCPDCGKRVKWYESTTKQHNGWIFYRCRTHGNPCDFWHWELEYVEFLVERNILRDDDVVEALGAAQDGREELNAAGEGDGWVASNQSRGGKPMSRRQADVLIAVGRDAVVIMKCIFASVMLLCGVGLLVLLKK